MNNYLYLDIETIPSQSPEYAARLAETLKPPANYKNEDAIAKWRADNTDAAIAKTSFDGGRGHVCCIAWAYGDELIRSNKVTNIDTHERGVISTFFDSLDKYHSTTIVGHYVGGFDIRFLTQRAVCLGVKLPPSNVWPRDPKPWSDSIDDTMLMWAGQKGTVSLDELGDILGIPGKGDFTGADVAAAWERGEHDRIAEYCREDVERTRAIHKRFLDVGW